MITFVLIALAVGFGMYVLYTKIEKPRDKTEAGAAIALSYTVGLGVGLLISGTIGYSLPTKNVPIKEVKIVAIRDSNGTQEDFFIGHGLGESGEYYEFYMKTKNGGRKYCQLPVIRRERVGLITEIIEEKRQDGVWRQYKQKVKRGYHCWGFSFFLDKINKIHIPEGSVKINFSLDSN